MRASLQIALQAHPTTENPGLTLDRYLVSDDPEHRKQLFKQVVAAGVPATYRLRYARWRAALLSPNSSPNSRLGEFSTSGRLIVGLGNESVHETGLTLQHVDGVPYLPGSALKGLANHYFARYANSNRSELPEESKYHDVLFGTSSGAGYVTYFDAWYVPGSAPDDHPLALDTITVHHPRYYTGRPRRAPWDLDDPNLVAFLSVRGRFLIALRGPDPGWAEFAFALLKQALGDWGAGAKTSSGYGRLDWLEDVIAVSSGIRPGQESVTSADHPLIQELGGVPSGRMRQVVGGVVQRAERLEEPDRGVVLRAVIVALQADPPLWRWAHARPWFLAVARYVSPADTETGL